MRRLTAFTANDRNKQLECRAPVRELSRKEAGGTAMSVRKLAVLGAVLAMFESCPVAAQTIFPPEDHSYCDGYGIPAFGGDGLHAQRQLFAGKTADAPTRWAVPLGRDGAVNCDSELAVLPKKMQLRQASYLQARAVHSLAMGSPKDALAYIEESKAAAGTGDAYYQRSMLLGDKLIEAAAKRRAGDQPTAVRMALGAWQARPYSRQNAFAALAAMGPNADDAAVTQVLYGLALLEPSMGEELFWRAIKARRFADVISLYPTLVAPMQVGDEPMDAAARNQLALTNQIVAERYAAETAGGYAYALAATGRGEEAREAITAARQRLADAVRSLSQSPAAASRQQDVVKLDEDSGRLIDRWESAVADRLADKDGHMDEALANLQIDHSLPAKSTTPAQPRLWGGLTFVNLGSHFLDEGETSAPLALNDLKTQWAQQSEADPRDLQILFDSLPDPETSDRVTRYATKKGLLAGSDFYGAAAHPDGSMTVTYVGMKASIGMVEEEALLHAAELALRAGKRGLIITGRKDYNHNTTVVYSVGGAGLFGVPITSFVSGFESRLEVLFVDPAALPTGYEGAAWRVIDAAKVYQELGPIYGAPVQVAASQ
jgi:hypothetical protein